MTGDSRDAGGDTGRCDSDAHGWDSEYWNSLTLWMEVKNIFYGSVVRGCVMMIGRDVDGGCK